VIELTAHDEGQRVAGSQRRDDDQGLIHRE
jgi:hypothetical protein